MNEGETTATSKKKIDLEKSNDVSRDVKSFFRNAAVFEKYRDISEILCRIKKYRCSSKTKPFHLVC